MKKPTKVFLTDPQCRRNQFEQIGWNECCDAWGGYHKWEIRTMLNRLQRDCERDNNSEGVVRMLWIRETIAVIKGGL